MFKIVDTNYIKYEPYKYRLCTYITYSTDYIFTIYYLKGEIWGQPVIQIIGGFPFVTGVTSREKKWTNPTIKLKVTKIIIFFRKTAPFSKFVNFKSDNYWQKPLNDDQILDCAVCGSFYNFLASCSWKLDTHWLKSIFMLLSDWFKSKTKH